MHLLELKKKTPADLVAMAEELGVEQASTLRKQDLLFGILKAKADSGEENEENADAAKKLQRMSIGPVSRGDADAVYAVCVSRGLVAAGLYKSEWSV